MCVGGGGGWGLLVYPILFPNMTEILLTLSLEHFVLVLKSTVLKIEEQYY